MTAVNRHVVPTNMAGSLYSQHHLNISINRSIKFDRRHRFLSELNEDSSMQGSALSFNDLGAAHHIRAIQIPVGATRWRLSPHRITRLWRVMAIVSLGALGNGRDAHTDWRCFDARVPFPTYRYSPIMPWNPLAVTSVWEDSRALVCRNRNIVNIRFTSSVFGVIPNSPRVVHFFNKCATLKAETIVVSQLFRGRISKWTQYVFICLHHCFPWNHLFRLPMGSTLDAEEMLTSVTMLLFISSLAWLTDLPPYRLV